MMTYDVEMLAAWSSGPGTGLCRLATWAHRRHLLGCALTVAVLSSLYGLASTQPVLVVVGLLSVSVVVLLALSVDELG